jgi:hypothetical protein
MKNQSPAQFTPTQLKRIEKFLKLINTIIPQIGAPKLFIIFLSKILPDYCIFERSIYIGGTLVLYIPQLCRFNPFFEAIMEYRLSTYDL